MPSAVAPVPSPPTTARYRRGPDEVNITFTKPTHRPRLVMLFAMMVTAATFVFFLAFERLPCNVIPGSYSVITDALYASDCETGAVDIDVDAVADLLRLGFASRSAVDATETERLNALGRALEAVAPTTATPNAYDLNSELRRRIRRRKELGGNPSMGDGGGAYRYAWLSGARSFFRSLFEALVITRRRGFFATNRRSTRDACHTLSVPTAYLNPRSVSRVDFTVPAAAAAPLRLWRGFTVCSEESTPTLSTALDPWLYSAEEDEQRRGAAITPALLVAALHAARRAEGHVPAVATAAATSVSVTALMVSIATLAHSVGKATGGQGATTSLTTLVMAAEPDSRLQAGHIKDLVLHAHHDLEASVVYGADWTAFARRIAWGPLPQPLIVFSRVWQPADGASSLRLWLHRSAARKNALYDWRDTSPGASPVFQPKNASWTTNAEPMHFASAADTITVAESFRFLYNARADADARQRDPMLGFGPSISVVDVGAWQESYGLANDDGYATSQGISIAAVLEYMSARQGDNASAITVFHRDAVIVLRPVALGSPLTPILIDHSVRHVCHHLTSAATVTPRPARTPLHVVHLAGPNYDACATALSPDGCAEWVREGLSSSSWAVTRIGALMSFEPPFPNAPCALWITTDGGRAASPSTWIRDALKPSTAAESAIRSGPASPAFVGDYRRSISSSPATNAAADNGDVAFTILKWVLFGLAAVVGCLLVRGISKNFFSASRRRRARVVEASA